MGNSAIRLSGRVWLVELLAASLGERLKLLSEGVRKQLQATKNKNKDGHRHGARTTETETETWTWTNSKSKSKMRTSTKTMKRTSVNGERQPGGEVIVVCALVLSIMAEKLEAVNMIRPISGCVVVSLASRPKEKEKES